MSKVSELVNQLEKELLSSKESSRAYMQECIKLNMQVEKLEKLLVKASSENTILKMRIALGEL